MSRESYHSVPTHLSRKILPENAIPEKAWAEDKPIHQIQKKPSTNLSEIQLLIDPSGYVSQEPLITRNDKDLSRKTYVTQTNNNFWQKKKKLISLLKPPFFIITVIVINVSVYAWSWKEFRDLLEWSPTTWWKQPWRLVTYSCVHASVEHLALNSLVALVVGWRLESEQSWWRVLCVWYGGVAAGALGAGVLQSNVHVVGASAAVYALLTAHLPNVCLRFGHIPLWWFRLLSVVVLSTSETIFAILQREALKHVKSHRSGHDQVAWSAHVLGAAIGIPLAFLVFTGENKSKRLIWICRLVSIGVLAAGILLAIWMFLLGF